MISAMREGISKFSPLRWIHTPMATAMDLHEAGEDGGGEHFKHRRDDEPEDGQHDGQRQKQDGEKKDARTRRKNPP